MKRSTWGSQIGFILATAGSAIGLGNIWRFPYLAGQNGGGSFLLLYLISVFGLGYFVLLSKLALGRLANSNIIDGFKKAAAQGGKNISQNYGRFAGFLTMFNTVFVTGIYLVVIGWTLFYFVNSLFSLLKGDFSVPNKEIFNGLVTSFSEQLMWGVFCALSAGLILLKGVKKGIEKMSLYLMPILFLLLAFMVIRIAFIPQAIRGIEFFLIPDLKSLGFSSQGFDLKVFADLFLKALGQAIYSLSMGLGVIFIYGSYTKKNENLLSSTRYIVLLDTLVAFMAGLIILPAVFAFNLEPNTGPTLTFITIPLIFSKITGGFFLMAAFFLLLFIAALTSLVSLYEPPINLLMEKTRLSRRASVFLVMGLNVLITLVILASYTNRIPITLFGKNLLDFFDFLTGTFTMTLFVLFVALFMGWRISTALVKNLQEGSPPFSKFFKRYLRFTLRFTAPLVLILLLINGFLN